MLLGCAASTKDPPRTPTTCPLPVLFILFLWIFCESFFFYYYLHFFFFVFILFMLFNSHKQEAGGTWTRPRLFTHSHHETNPRSLFLSLSHSPLAGYLVQNVINAVTPLAKMILWCGPRRKSFTSSVFAAPRVPDNCCQVCVSPLPPLATSYINIYTLLPLPLNRRWVRVTRCWRPLLQGGSRCAGEVIAEQPHLLLRREQQQH